MDGSSCRVLQVAGDDGVHRCLSGFVAETKGADGVGRMR